MPFDGSGTYAPPAPPVFPAITGTTISSAYFNQIINDIAAALSECLVPSAATSEAVAISSLFRLVTAAETISARDFVTIDNSSGAPRLRRALAVDGSKPAHGYCPSAVASGNLGLILFGGINPVTGLVGTAAPVYLDPASAGGYTFTAPSVAGQLSQPLGIALPGVGIAYTYNQGILL